MKTWKKKPRKQEVETTISSFFELLSKGKLNDAKKLVNHKFDDWDSQIWNLWQDTYLIKLEDLNKEAEDDTFGGNFWKNDLNWLQNISIEKEYRWDDDYVTVNVVYIFIIHVMLQECYTFNLLKKSLTDQIFKLI